MAITKLNSLAIPPNTIVESDLSYPLTNFSSTGIDDNATSTAVTIDASENVGIGTTPSAWRSTESVIQLPDGVFYSGNNYSAVGQNYYIPVSGGAIYEESNFATDYYQTLGTHVWRTAASGTAGASISWSEAMRIDSSGNVGIGTTSPARTFHVNSGTANAVSVFESTDATAYIQLKDTGGSGAVGTTGSGNGLRFWLGDAATEAMRIDSSGNVGIGSAGPSQKLHVEGGDVLIKSEYNASGTTDALIYFASRTAGNWRNAHIGQSGNALVFATGGTGTTHTNGAERVRIDSSGNLLVGQTTTDIANIGIGMRPSGRLRVATDSAYAAEFNRKGSDGGLLLFYNDTVVCGSVSVSGSTTSYNTSSDQRLKENIRDYDNALTDVMKLKPRKYSWKADGAEDNGFIAQELLETPEFANRVNSIGDGDDPMYGVDYMKFVAVLTGAIQEQQAMIEELKAEVAALKGA